MSNRINKHAYLIIAHNNFYILEKLIQLLDYEKNDIYIHIDKKVKNFDFTYYKNLAQKSKVFYTERIDVRWGDISIIKAEMALFKKASGGGKKSKLFVLSSNIWSRYAS